MAVFLSEKIILDFDKNAVLLSVMRWEIQVCHLLFMWLVFSEIGIFFK